LKGKGGCGELVRPRGPTPEDGGDAANASPESKGHLIR